MGWEARPPPRPDRRPDAQAGSSEPGADRPDEVPACCNGWRPQDFAADPSCRPCGGDGKTRRPIARAGRRPGATGRTPPRTVDAFLDRHPGVLVEVDLLAEDVDLALRLGEVPSSGLVARRLASFPLILVAAPAYLSSHPAPGRPKDLAHHQVLIHAQTRASACWSFIDAAGTREGVAVDGRVRASDTGFLLDLACSAAAFSWPRHSF